MNSNSTIACVLTLLALSRLVHDANAEIYSGCCGTSAAVALDEEHFVIADDEDNKLRLYSNRRFGAPEHVWNFDKPLRLDEKSLEADLEGAARIGDVIYWIGSHGRNKDGELRMGRHCFFATQVRLKKGRWHLDFTGKPYRQLLQDMASDPRLDFARLRAASQLSPKAEGGLNIEGMSRRREGGLWIGFRNPVPSGQALLIALENPEEVVRGSVARLGPPARLALNGLGIRDLAFDGRRYWILAGNRAGSGVSRLYSWSGGAEAPVRRGDARIDQLNPEAIVLPAKDEGALTILSDDGSLRVRGKQCDDLPRDKRQFRALLLPAAN